MGRLEPTFEERQVIQLSAAREKKLLLLFNEKKSRILIVLYKEWIRRMATELEAETSISADVVIRYCKRLENEMIVTRTPRGSKIMLTPYGKALVFGFIITQNEEATSVRAAQLLLSLDKGYTVLKLLELGEKNKRSLTGLLYEGRTDKIAKLIAVPQSLNYIQIETRNREHILRLTPNGRDLVKRLDAILLTAERLKKYTRNEKPYLERFYLQTMTDILQEKPHEKKKPVKKRDQEPKKPRRDPELISILGREYSVLEAEIYRLVEAGPRNVQEIVAGVTETESKPQIYGCLSRLVTVIEALTVERGTYTLNKAKIRKKNATLEDEDY